MVKVACALFEAVKKATDDRLQATGKTEETCEAFSSGTTRFCGIASASNSGSAFSSGETQRDHELATS